MRAGYLAVVLALAGTVAIGIVTGWTSPRGPDPGPVAAALGFGGADAPDLERRRGAAVTEAIRRCMDARGFPDVVVTEPPPAIPDPDLDPVAWAARWGFGVSTAVGIATPAPVADPLMASLARLGARDRSAVLRALDGDPTQRGCRAIATDAVYGLRERLLDQLRGALTGLQGAIEADPAMAAVRDRWRQCVDEVPATLGAPGLATDRDRLLAAALEAVAASVKRAGSDAAALADVQRRERAAATRIARCEAAFATDRAAVARPHEAAFVARHWSVLGAIARRIRAVEASWPAP